MATQDNTYSTNVRFPGELKEQMQQRAEKERRSVNGLIVFAVELYLNWPAGRIPEQQET